MAQYLIHAMPKRIWYVNEYLIPSMIEQGIKAEDIRVYNDEKREGNLKACMKAYEMCEGDGGTWHLQDDVCISSSFKVLTEKHDTGIVCGFKSEYDGTQMPGIVPVQNMWFSFPCIRIPNSIAREVAKWVQTQMIGNPVYKSWWERGVNDDLFFRRYVWDKYPDMEALNLDPNVVDHIDYLIGGTVNSNARIRQIRAIYFDDLPAVEKLEKWLEVHNGQYRQK